MCRSPEWGGAAGGRGCAARPPMKGTKAGDGEQGTDGQMDRGS